MRTGTRSHRLRWLRRSSAQAGRDGELLAVLLYALQGYRILGRNVRTPVAQVDVLCRRGSLLVVAIVSGLARGIDAGAHEGALERGGRTVAVLGCGIDRDYPSATLPLARRITNDGAVISEYAPGTPPAPFRFPERNRIVAGLADATIVVEAAMRSGALITARLALELGRDVFAVPGAPWLSGAAGTNALLKDGALLLTETSDVLVALGIDPGHVRASDPVLQGPAARVLAALRREPVSADVLAARCGLTSAVAAALIVELELAGVVVRERDGRLVPCGAR